MTDCVFCEISTKQANKELDGKLCILESKHCLAIPDKYPCSKGHSLIISKQHYENVLSTDDEVLQDAILLGKSMAKHLLTQNPEIKGFKYLSNQGSSAGQIIFHLHIHIIPQY